MNKSALVLKRQSFGSDFFKDIALFQPYIKLKLYLMSSLNRRFRIDKYLAWFDKFEGC